jgi:hypothetical protein
LAAGRSGALAKEGVITRSQGESDQNQGNPDCLAAVMRHGYKPA